MIKIDNKCYYFSVEPLFDHEKLDVYCLELQFVAWIADFFFLIVLELELVLGL